MFDAGTLGSTARQSERRWPFNHLQGWMPRTTRQPPRREDVMQVPKCQQ